MAWVDVGGGRLHAAVWGEQADGPAVVCVHGLGGSHVNWSLLGPRLAPRGRVWAVDLPGFGLSPLGERRTDLQASLDVLVAFVRSVSPDRPVVAVGNSMGGLLAVMLAARHAELLAGLALVNPALPVRRLQAMEPLAILDFSMLVLPGAGAQWLRWRRGRITPEQQVRQAMRFVLADPDALDEDVLGAHIELAVHRRGVAYADRAYLQATRSVVRRLTLGARAVWADIAAVAAPTLLVQGGRDRITEPSSGRLIARLRTDWRHRTYHDLGHMPMLEDPDRLVADLTDWLPV